jgi:hypothetical protein
MEQKMNYRTCKKRYLTLTWASLSKLNTAVILEVNHHPVSTLLIAKIILRLWKRNEIFMSMEQWWNDTDRIKPGYSNLSRWYFIHHKSHTDWPRI